MTSNMETMSELLDTEDSKQIITDDNNAIFLMSNLESGHVICEDQVEIDSGELKENVGSVAIYSCSSCGVKFLSVLEHIQQFHSDQEVVIEMEEDATLDSNPIEEVTLLQVFEGTEAETQALVEESQVVENEVTMLESTIDESKSNYEPAMVADSKKNNSTSKNWKTLCEQQCVDSDGRVYTRKVVQIERFWEPKGEEIKKECVNGEVEELQAHIENVDSEVEERQAHMEEEVQLQENGTEPVISRVYHCVRCSAQYNSFEEFDIHSCASASEAVKVETKYKCEHCDVAYSNSKSLCAHMKVHKGIKKKLTPRKTTDNQNGTFKCDVCDTSFPTNKSLRLHSRMHDPIKQRPIEAPVEYKSSSKRVVKDELLDPGSKVDKFHCQLCNKWMHVGYKKVHEMTFHAGLEQYNCEICNRKFFTEENLEMHLTVHNSEKVVVNKTDRPLPYECNYCNRQFSRPHEKVKHERIHTGERPHVCEICGKAFRVSYCLTLHMRTHTGARPYECSHCGKRFKAHSVYNHHVLTHSNIRAYKCPYCPKSFKTSVQLAGHKNAHTKPFSCTECNRPFASLYAVRVHMETHKRRNNLKFNCEMCGASYARAFALKDHIKSHMNVQVEESKEFYIPEVAAATLAIIPKDEHEKFEKVVDIVIENVEDEDLAQVAHVTELQS